uniref:BCLAF1 and THRAP3 family member 3 n=2 Tax=Oryzias latipes TaxID=8090 RepID=A0A3P9M5D5_ORYLA
MLSQSGILSPQFIFKLKTILFSKVDKMSRPRSRSPNYRRLPSGQRDFSPDRVLSDRKHHDPFPDDPRFGPQHHLDQGRLPTCRPLPPPDPMYYDKRRLSPPRDGGYEVDRHRGETREHVQRNENRRRSPTWSKREEFSFRGHHQRKPGMNWRGEDQGRGRGGFRDSSPGMRPDEGRGGYRGRWTGQGPNAGRFRDGLRHERGAPLKGPRREMDEHPGYRDENSGDAARGGFGGGSRGSFPHGHHRRSSPGDVDHSRELSEWERLENYGPHEPHFDRQRSPRSQRFKGPHSRGEGRGHAQGHRFDDHMGDPNYRDARKEPAFQEGPDNVRYGNRDRPFHHRGSWGASRTHYQRGGGRNDYHRNQPHIQHSHQDSAPKERPAHHPFRKEVPGPPKGEEPGWAEGHRRRQWVADAPRSSEDLDPKMPRQRMERGWSVRKDDDMAVETEETLTIKVDMSRPISQKSPLCYSSDRQLSLDLVNVGRQRLDFLPTLQHSGAHQESSVRVSAFAQEIITLVHLVKEQYFSGDGLTLSERFSAPQSAELSEDAEELTLNQRFSSNRGFSMNLDSVLDDEEPTQGLSKPPLRGPGDLRHDLERRRQEKLEGVKVTILGNSISQHAMGADSELNDAPQSEWAGQQRRRLEGNMGPRRGAPNRLNAGPPRRNFRIPYQRHGGPAGTRAQLLSFTFSVHGHQHTDCSVCGTQSRFIEEVLPDVMTKLHSFDITSP